MIVASLLGPTVGQLLPMAAVHSLKSHGISRSHIPSVSSFTGDKLKHRTQSIQDKARILTQGVWF